MATSTIKAKPIIKRGVVSYSNLKQGGWANRITIPITFDSPMVSANYDVHAESSGPYADYPYIRVYAFNMTAAGFDIVVINMAEGTAENLNGNIRWVAIMP